MPKERCSWAAGATLQAEMANTAAVLWEQVWRSMPRAVCRFSLQTQKLKCTRLGHNAGTNTAVW